MRILIIAAMQEEADAIKKVMNNVTETEGGTFGLIDNYRIKLVVCGVGKVNAAMITTEKINEFEPDWVINTGSAGALKAEMNIGEVVVSSAVAHHDVDLSAFGYEVGQLPKLPAIFPSKPLSQDFESVGLIVSGDTFITANRVDEVIRKFPDALCCEMEASAIAQVCHIKNVPFTAIRSISDNPFKNANSVDFKQFLPVAARNAATTLLKLLALEEPKI